ncbi:hypothetical protein EVJ58_g11090 [Rhodofomes roseus]|uniref:Uncharacterized protein n=1 Tax=Rhodofomes roseus TaxID=34475 RepID=A0A4Y9XKX8_9APHY|nr:hypothetical protein EVJ58_g11090 [Rhodofomes roseus]
MGSTSPHAQEKRVKRTRNERGETVVQAELQEHREHNSALEDEDLVMNPRLVKTMPKRPNAGPLVKTLYPWPDPNNPPTGFEHDPHSHRTRNVTPAPTIPKSRIAFTDAVFERLYLPLDSLVDNIREEQQTQIRANPGEFLAVVPFGAGAALFKEKPRLNNAVVGFLKTFRYPDAELKDSLDETLTAIIENGSPTKVEAAHRAKDNKNPDATGLQLVMPASRRTGTSRDKFARPWAMFLRGGSPRLREYLIYQQTFAIDKDLAFNVLKIEAKTPSWVLCNFKGDAVRKDQEEVIMKAIKEKLWMSDDFRHHATKVLTKARVPGDINAHTVYATSSFTLTFFENTDEKGNAATVVQLRGCPVASTDEELKDYHAIVRTTPYWIDNMILLQRAGEVSCQLCKAVTHPTYDCPFPKTEGWFGPKYDGAEKHAARVQKTAARGGKYGSQGRGGPSRGSANRGGLAGRGKGRK